MKSSFAAAPTSSMTAGGSTVLSPDGEPTRTGDDHFRQAFARAAVGFAITGMDEIIQDVNERFCQITGCTEEELVGGTFAAITHPDDLAHKLAWNQQLLDGEIDDYIVETRYLRKNGGIAWAENSVSTIRDKQGVAVNMLILCKDISARKEAEAAATRTHRCFQEQQEALNALMRGGALQAEDLGLALKTITRMTADVLAVERVSVWRLNPQQDCLVCLLLHEVTPDLQSTGMELHARKFPAYFKALASREIIAHDARTDPRTRELRESYLDPLGITSILDAPFLLNGALEGVLCLEHVGPRRKWTADEQNFAISTANLVSLVLAQMECRRIEEALRQLASLLDKAQDAILVRDLNHIVTYWNKGAERMYGWTAEEAVGRNVSEFLLRDDAAFQQALAQTLARDEWTGETKRWNKEDVEVTAEERWTLVRDAYGQPASIFCISTNITEKKKLEELFVRAQRMENIGTLAGGIAHDLNNILTPILMSIDMLRLRISDASAQETLSMISGSTRRGASMVQQVLSLARDKGLNGSKLPVSPHQLLQDIAEIIRDTFPKNIQLEVREAPGLWDIHGDATQIHQALLNLCVNARDAMPAGGRLSVTASNFLIDAQFATSHMEMHAGPYVLLTVQDSGGGIDREIVEKIFDPFFTTKVTGDGTGLGLASAQAIIKNHAGFIRVSSEPESGSCFSVHLPAETTPKTVVMETALANEDTPPLRGNNQLVLVIDDESCVREVTRQTLETFGYRALLAADGAEAVRLYSQRQQEIAVILTDMMMPVMDGAATIQVLKKINPKARIIAASGVPSQSGSALAAEVDVSCFLPKPYSAEMVLRTLHQILNES